MFILLLDLFLTRFDFYLLFIYTVGYFKEHKAEGEISQDVQYQAEHSWRSIKRISTDYYVFTKYDYFYSDFVTFAHIVDIILRKRR